MELVKNIFFNTDKLTQNSKVKLSYTGELLQNESEEVFIHYGFGYNWENIGEVKMEKTELGFQAEIELLESDTFNFCFKNNLNMWDNNNGENYVFELESIPTDLVRIETSIGKPNKLRKTYLWSKKIRIAVYKIITILPKLISGNYRRKVENKD